VKREESLGNKLVDAVSSGANPLSYGKPVSIPQDAPSGKSSTHHALEAYFDFDRDGKREND
jgi:hypothetical protein